MLFIVIMGYNRCSPGVRDVNCRQLCFIKYQMLVLRSKPLARNDSVDVITGIGIVLVLPNGFGSIGIVGFDDSYIFFPTLWFCIYFFHLFCYCYRRLYCLNMYTSCRRRVVTSYVSCEIFLSVLLFFVSCDFLQNLLSLLFGVRFIAIVSTELSVARRDNVNKFTIHITMNSHSLSPMNYVCV